MRRMLDYKYRYILVESHLTPEVLSPLAPAVPRGCARQAMTVGLSISPSSTGSTSIAGLRGEEDRPADLRDCRETGEGALRTPDGPHAGTAEHHGTVL